MPVDDLAQRARPAVLASYNNELPMLAAAAVGARAGSLPDDEPFSRVDDAPRSAAIGLADGPHRSLRVVRDADLVERQTAKKGWFCRSPSASAGPDFTLVDPDGKPQALSVDALGGDRYGIGLNDLDAAGHLSREGRAERQRGPG